MKKKSTSSRHTSAVDSGRRRLLGAAGATTLAGIFSAFAGKAAAETPTMRWGIVGTGGIANSMAPRIKEAAGCELTAVSSRRLQSAQEFAGRHGVPNSYDSWLEMAKSDDVDALYIATPTSVKEEIGLAALEYGKHILVEKPFADLPSVKRMTSVCRRKGLIFMDGTHFVHHPRTLHIREQRKELLGWPWSVSSAFQFNLQDRSNIRFNPELEPMGAIGDTGWYNMRAAIEYLGPDAEPVAVSAFLRRDTQTDAVISGSGVIKFDDGSVTTWNCGFDSGSVVMDLRITGTAGVINIDNFLSNDRDGSASFQYRKGGWGPGATDDQVSIPGSATSSTLMFRDFAAMVDDAVARETSMRASERTQRLLDASWAAAIDNEDA